MRASLALATLSSFFLYGAAAQEGVRSTVPTAAPLTSESTGKIGAIATRAVMRVICPEHNSAGTAFLHKSGKLLTADHVVHDCAAPVLLLTNGTTNKITIVASDADLDIAILNPALPIVATPLGISSLPDFIIGAQVTTWGFPAGYANSVPILSVGYLAGTQPLKTDSGKIVQRYVVNAAFNAGNSGGPLIHIETGEVMGIVSSKLAPISDNTMSALHALQAQHNGFTYTATKSDGTTATLSEGQVVAMVLDELRQQIQLVIGMAIPNQDIRSFLIKNGISP
jgi:S1-C subfamily serine protease